MVASSEKCILGFALVPFPLRVCSAEALVGAIRPLLAQHMDWTILQVLVATVVAFVNGAIVSNEM